MLLAALLVAAASVASAVRMPAANPDAHGLAGYLAAGGTLDDLCGLAPPAAQDHHCPFCRLIGDPPSTGPVRPGERVAHVLVWRALDDLTAGPQRGYRPLSARAPPTRA